LLVKASGNSRDKSGRNKDGGEDQSSRPNALDILQAGSVATVNAAHDAEQELHL